MGATRPPKQKMNTINELSIAKEGFASPSLAMGFPNPIWRMYKTQPWLGVPVPRLGVFVPGWAFPSLGWASKPRSVDPKPWLGVPNPRLGNPKARFGAPKLRVGGPQAYAWALQA